MFRFKFGILASLLILLTTSGCDSSSETADTMMVEEEQPDTPELMYSCNETRDRAELLNEMPLDCDQEPESVVLEDDGRQFEIFKYEASHPPRQTFGRFPAPLLRVKNLKRPIRKRKRAQTRCDPVAQRALGRCRRGVRPDRVAPVHP